VVLDLAPEAVTSFVPYRLDPCDPNLALQRQHPIFPGGRICRHFHYADHAFTGNKRNRRAAIKPIAAHIPRGTLDGLHPIQGREVYLPVQTAADSFPSLRPFGLRGYTGFVPLLMD